MRPIRTFKKKWANEQALKRVLVIPVLEAGGIKTKRRIDGLKDWWIEMKLENDVQGKLNKWIMKDHEIRFIMNNFK